MQEPRSLPQDLAAEAGLLGSILLDAERVMDLCMEKRVVPEAFLNRGHRLVYTAMERLYAVGSPIDGITVANRLTEAELKLIGGMKVLRQWVDQTPSSANAGFYIDLMMEAYMRRLILGTMRDIEASVYDNTKSSAYLLGEAEQAILRIGEGRANAGSIASWNQSVWESLHNLQRCLEHPGELLGQSTGFKGLDAMTGGLQRGSMFTLAGRPSMGKTALAMNIAECVARRRMITGEPMPTPSGASEHSNVLIFSMEMPLQQLMKRMLCGIAKVSSRDLEHGNYLNKQYVLARLEEAAKVLREMSLFCDDQGGLDVTELRARARHIHKKHPLDLIVIDYLQLLSYREFASQGQQVMISKISGEIKAMAKELNVPVLVLSQLNRSTETRGGDERPRNSDLRDSGAIEQDSDVIALLRRPCFMSSRVPEHEDKTLAIVEVSKNRNGPTGEVRLNFDGSLTRFSDRIETNPTYIAC